MKKNAFIGLMSLLYFCSFAQIKAPRLIVRGDDMGFSHSGNEALIKCYKEGIQTSIEIIVPSPWFPEAVKLLKQHPGADVGIHLAITSEWDNFKWRPLTRCPSLTDSNGYFYPMVYPNKNYPKQAILENDWKLEDVEREFRAQIETALKHLPWISHLSAHMGCANMKPEVRELTKKLALEYKIPVSPDITGLTSVSYKGARNTSDEKIQSFINMLGTLETGKTYIFVDHPGIDNDELRAIHHIGYEGVALDRQGVTDVFTSDKVKAAIRQRGIELIGYKDLVPKKN